MRLFFISILSITTLFLFSSFAKAKSPLDTSLQKEIKTVLQNNPELILEAFKGHEEKLYDLMQVGLEKKNKTKIRNRQKKQLDNPNIPLSMPNRPLWGNPNGDISIFAYSDFQSASCSKANKIIQELLKKDPKINYRYRHNPQGFHKMSRPAALYYEALARQDHQKAILFNSLLFANRSKINKDGLKELDTLVSKAGGNLPLLHRDIKSVRLFNLVDRDINEAKKFGFTASPVFVINGVTISGAAPLKEFKEVIQLIRDHMSK
ncbi:thioredoxin domain-containing protein [Maridesulfovibrio ferrireducens]|uniref:DsbA family protein n=1 Tax=Maridesulfovibrio ferrireducens TaxID=246191 RepID=UPI001A2EF07E|nr:thioredoxin domain-containing protein [Maridesulfovibrio ferrireducens]MBI9111748.1 thioredoxin domain-containing protein [Maridesulfovibrio ferrireducens]